MNDNEMVKQALAESMKNFEDCVLCGKRTRNRGIYIPNDSKEIGAPEGKTRVVIYAICYKHVDTQEKANQAAEKSEEYIHKNISKFNNLTNYFKGVV